MSLIDELTRHAIYLERYATDILKSNVYPDLESARKAVIEILRAKGDIRTPSQAQKLSAAIQKILGKEFEQLFEAVQPKLDEIAVFESSYYAGLIGSAGAVTLSEPGKKAIKDFIDEAVAIFGEGEKAQVFTWKKAIQEFRNETAQTLDAIAIARWQRKLSLKDTERLIGLLFEGATKNQAESLIRTGTQFYANNARRAMVNDNLDIIDREFPLVVFDNRRSVTCSSIYQRYKDGWPVNESPVGYPPYHYRCRTNIIVGLKGQPDPRGDMPAIGAGADYPEDSDKMPRYKGRKDIGKFEIEKVQYGDSLDNWMIKQGEPFVRDNLGATKAKLLIEGKLSLARMADVIGRPLNIQQLRALYPDAFTRAGL